MLKQTLIKSLMICAVAILAIHQPAYAQNSEFKIIPDDGAAGDNFGISASIDGDYAVVGAYFDDDNGSNSGSAYIFKRSGTSWVQEAKLLPVQVDGTTSDGAVDDYFGRSVSISGDYVIVGAYLNDDNGSNSGSAYVFKRTGTTWDQEAKLLPVQVDGTTSDGAVDDFFGFSVSISGNYVVVGAKLDDDNGTDSGSAYVFKRSGTSWTQEAKLLPVQVDGTTTDGDIKDRFGGSVSISGDYAVVGAYWDGDNDSNSGSAYIFKRTGASWAQEAKLLPPDVGANQWFGVSAAISGDYAAVGALFHNGLFGINTGSAYVFKRSSTGWGLEAELLASDLEGNDNFGASVSISGDKVVVGATKNSDNGPWSGSAYLYRRTGTGWTEEMKFLASDAASNDRFGQSVAIYGGYAIVGSQQDSDQGGFSGSAYLYGFFTPFIAGIIDVPHDQGRNVTLNWNASSLDVNVDSLVYYSIWRALPDGMELQGIENSVVDITADFEGLAYRIESVGRNDLAWEWIANQPAHRFDMYSYTAPTLFDSSLTTDGKHYFMVSAHTNQPDLFYDSMADSGYSVDNLAPAVPTGLLASITDENTVKLSWDEPVDEDFQYFKVYRMTPDFDPTGMDPFAETIDTTFIDSDIEIGETYYYILSAVDFNGNESKYTDAVEATVILSIDDLSGIPTEFGLHQNYPNPFNPITRLRYDIPEQSHVTLVIYNLLGREIRTLVNRIEEPGYKSVIWDATNEIGEPVSAGVYVYQIRAGNNIETRKMVLLK